METFHQNCKKKDNLCKKKDTKIFSNLINGRQWSVIGNLKQILRQHETINLGGFPGNQRHAICHR
jgi:hypothetical protein